MAFGLRTKVKCPKCKKTFEYVFIPGGSLTSMRLGRYRYMKCRRCGKFATFDLLTNLDPNMKKHIHLSQLISGIVLFALGVCSFVLSNLYTNSSVGFLALRVISIISIILSVIILIGLYVYVEKKE